MPYWQFWQQVKRAEAESEAIAVGYLMKSMPKAPTAVISWLERRFRERWSRMEHLQHVAEIRQRVYAGLARLAVIESYHLKVWK